MDKESVIRSLTQQAFNSGHNLAQLQEILTQNYGQDLQSHSDFPHLWAELQRTFPKIVTSVEIPKVTGDRTFHPAIATDNVFHQLQCVVRDGSASERFPVGTLIPDTWTDPKTGIVYLMPFIVVDYRPMELTTSHTSRFAAILLRQNATPYEIQFSPENKNTYSISQLHAYLNDDSETGYLAGCSPELLDTIAPIVISPTLWDEGMESFEAKFFAPSLEEFHFIPHDKPEMEVLSWKYFQDTPTDRLTLCAKRIFRDPAGVERSCWLRSAYRGSAHVVWVANTGGSVDGFIANYTIACAPACAIA